MTPPASARHVLRLLAFVAALCGLLAAPALARPGASAGIPGRNGGTEAQPTPAAPRPQALALAEPRKFVAPARAAAPAGGPDFVGGLLGGLAGAGLFALLAGQAPLHGLDGSFAGFLGLGLQLALVLVLMALSFVLLRRLPRITLPGMSHQLAHAYPQGYQQNGPGFADRLGPRFAPRGGSARHPAGAASLALDPNDFQAFERALKEIKSAWSRQDIPGMQGLCTPEMVQSFADQLARLASRGLRNKLADVVLEQGDLAETWHEGDRQYATVALRFSLVDCTRNAANRVMGGDPVKRNQVTEVWTFTRSRGGRWLLSAVQGTH
jgi:predicted lipid-binding transport protein (Tim44 family)